MRNFASSDQKQVFSGKLASARDQLFYYALQLTEDRDEALDLVQETSYKALKNFTRLKDLQHRNAWLYTILKNTHINNLRSGHYRNIVTNRSDQDAHVTLATLPEYENPDRVYERKELNEKIKCLPAVYAQPLKLFLAGYAYKEIARMMDVPIGTVKSRIHLAKEKLKKAYRVC